MSHTLSWSLQTLDVSYCPSIFSSVFGDYIRLKVDLLRWNHISLDEYQPVVGQNDSNVCVSKNDFPVLSGAYYCNLLSRQRTPTYGKWTLQKVTGAKIYWKTKIILSGRHLLLFIYEEIMVTKSELFSIYLTIKENVTVTPDIFVLDLPFGFESESDIYSLIQNL
jgi:hypothetical protein